MKSPRATLAGLCRKYGEERVNLLMDEEFTPEVKGFLAGLEYRKVVIPLSDKDVPERFQESAKKWRRLARAMGWNGTVTYLVKPGYSMVEDPKFIKGHGYIPELLGEPTAPALVFCILLFRPEFIGQTQTASLNKELFGQNNQAQTTRQEEFVVTGAEEKKALLAMMRKQFELPEHHLSGFGSPNMLAALIQSHFRRTGECIPPQYFCIYTDIVTGVIGLRSVLFLDKEGRAGVDTAPNSGRPTIGCLPIGVEALD